MQNLNRPQRIFIFVLGIVGGLLLLVFVFAFLVMGALQPGAREQAQALVNAVQVAEFAQLPDNDAYPATVAVGMDGTVYTASYRTGTIWAIQPTDGTLTELANTRDMLGSVTGMTVTTDGALYVVDQLDPDPRASSGIVRRIVGTEISDFANINDERGFVEPEDIALDSLGRIYVTDRGRGEVWRFNADGVGGELWWTAPQVTANVPPAPNGIAYDALTDSMLISDSDANVIYRVYVSDARVEVVYSHSGRDNNPPGFDGLTVTPAGEIYAALLGLRAVALVTPDTNIETPGTLTLIAGPFRGASDVVYAAVPAARLYVTNFDSASLVLPGVSPQLPFALDVITLDAGN